MGLPRPGRHGEPRSVRAEPEDAAASSERVWDLARTIRAGGHPRPLMTIRADLFVALLDGTLVGLTNAQIVQAMLARGVA